jgi:hypothetical protein
MDLTLTTPALLFPAISLLLLAYTNRFLTLANLIRELHARYKEKPEEIILGQIKNLRYRIVLIRDMQIFGASSFFLCVMTMLALFIGQALLGKILFGIALVCLLVSLGYSLRELQVSIDALMLRLSDIEKLRR